MDFVKPWTFIKDDEEWLVKSVIGIVIGFLMSFVIGIFPLYGYTIAVARNVAAGKEKPLPGWDDIVELSKDGFFVFVAQLIWGIPLFIIIGIGVAIFVGSITAMEAGNMAQSQFEAIAGAGGLLMFCVFSVLALIYGFINYALLMQYAKHGTLNSTFRIGEVLGIARRNASSIFVFMIVSAIASLLYVLLSLVSSVICVGIVLFLAIYYWQYAGMGHVVGQLMRKEFGTDSFTNNDIDQLPPLDPIADF